MKCAKAISEIPQTMVDIVRASEKISGFMDKLKGAPDAAYQKTLDIVPVYPNMCLKFPQTAWLLH